MMSTQKAILNVCFLIGQTMSRVFLQSWEYASRVPGQVQHLEPYEARFSFQLWHASHCILKSLKQRDGGWLAQGVQRDSVFPEHIQESKELNLLIETLGRSWS
jgi:hypothetical protein